MDRDAMLDSVFLNGPTFFLVGHASVIISFIIKFSLGPASGKTEFANF